MGIVAALTQARLNSAATNSFYHLSKAVDIVPIGDQMESYRRYQEGGQYASLPNWEVLGDCGHRLTVLSPAGVDAYRAKMNTGRGKRHRCIHCPG